MHRREGRRPLNVQLVPGGPFGIRDAPFSRGSIAFGNDEQGFLARVRFDVDATDDLGDDGLCAGSRGEPVSGPDDEGQTAKRPRGIVR